MKYYKDKTMIDLKSLKLKNYHLDTETSDEAGTVFYVSNETEDDFIGLCFSNNNGNVIVITVYEGCVLKNVYALQVYTKEFAANYQMVCDEKDLENFIEKE